MIFFIAIALCLVAFYFVLSYEPEKEQVTVDDIWINCFNSMILEHDESTLEVKSIYDRLDYIIKLKQEQELKQYLRDEGCYIVKD